MRAKKAHAMRTSGKRPPASFKRRVPWSPTEREARVRRRRKLQDDE